MLADGTAVWMRMRVGVCACAVPLVNTVAAVPAATPFNSERRNMKSPFRIGRSRAVLQSMPRVGIARDAALADRARVTR